MTFPVDDLITGVCWCSMKQYGNEKTGQDQKLLGINR